MLRLIAFTACMETVTALQHLLHRAVRGQLRGIVLCTWSVDRGSEVILTGAYRAQPERALGAADLIKVEAAHQLDLFA